MEKIKELLQQAEEGYKAEITEIMETTSHKYFGVDKYDDREGYKVVFTVKSGDEELTVFDEFFNIPKPTGLADSKIYRFSKKYGELPKIGMKVECLVVDGYFKVVL